MPVQIIRGAEVNRPSVTPLASSVLDHAEVVDLASFGLRNNAGLWPSYNCLDTLVPTPLCPDPLLSESGDIKTFSFADWMVGFEFAVYGGVQCKSVGLDEADQKAEVERVFRANEGKGVEQALLLNRFVASDAGADISWDAPVDVTPGSAVPLPVAFALLEGYAASVYSGQATIHMSRAAASLLGADKIVWQGGKAYSRLGNKIAIGGGYDSDTVPPSGAWTMYATGEVYVERSEEISVQSHVVPGDGTDVSIGDNSVLALVERAYRVGVDCFTAKATGTVWS